LLSTDAEWKTVANSNNPVAEQTVTHSTTWDDHADILIEAASLVGIKINDVVMEPGDIYSIVIDPALRNAQLEIFHATQYAGLLGTERQGIWMFIHYESHETFNYANIAIDDLDDLIWRYYTVNDTGGETQEVCNEIQELIRPLYLSIDWYQMETYSGILNKWEGSYGAAQNVIQNIKLVDDGGNGGTDLPPIPGFPLEAIGFVGAVMVVGLIFVMKRKTIKI
jgi:hypothetical protein